MMQPLHQWRFAENNGAYILEFSEVKDSVWQLFWRDNIEGCKKFADKLIVWQTEVALLGDSDVI
jgi:hypothetical protein